jgi:hypothetical protein
MSDAHVNTARRWRRLLVPHKLESEVSLRAKVKQITLVKETYETVIFLNLVFLLFTLKHDIRLLDCGLVAGVNGYRFKGPGFDSQRFQIIREVMDLEQSPLSLVRISGELLEWKISGPVSIKSRPTAMGIRCADHATSSISKFSSNFANKRLSRRR